MNIKKYLYAMSNMSVAGAYTFFRSRSLGRELLFQNCRTFRSLNQIGLKTIPLGSVLPEQGVVPLRVFAAPGGEGCLYESLGLCGVAQVFQCRKIFEIGTFHGYTTAHLALNTPEDAHVYTLDLPPGIMSSDLTTREGAVPVGAAIIDHRGDVDYVRAKGLERRVSYLYGDSRTFDYSAYAGKIDLVFVDGDHTYEYVKSDSENARAMLSDNGIIVWHDYGEPGGHVSVNRAVEEFAARYSNTYQIMNTRLAIHFRVAPALHNR